MQESFTFIHVFSLIKFKRKIPLQTFIAQLTTLRFPFSSNVRRGVGGRNVSMESIIFCDDFCITVYFMISTVFNQSSELKVIGVELK